MTDIPIIFSRPMVLALIEGRKTQTRRLAWSEISSFSSRKATVLDKEGRAWAPAPWQRVRVGDRLWVRENWRADDFDKDDADRTIYQADVPMSIVGETQGVIKWRPCIHLPRVRSRLTLIVAETKIEQLHEISTMDSEAEGVSCDMSARTFQDHFRELWIRLHGLESWRSNPEVVALTFDTHQKNIDALSEAA